MQLFTALFFLCGSAHALSINTDHGRVTLEGTTVTVNVRNFVFSRGITTTMQLPSSFVQIAANMPHSPSGHSQPSALVLELADRFSLLTVGKRASLALEDLPVKKEDVVGFILASSRLVDDSSPKSLRDAFNKIFRRQPDGPIELHAVVLEKSGRARAFRRNIAGIEEHDFGHVVSAGFDWKSGVHEYFELSRGQRVFLWMEGTRMAGLRFDGADIGHISPVDLASYGLTVGQAIKLERATHGVGDGISGHLFVPTGDFFVKTKERTITFDVQGNAFRDQHGRLPTCTSRILDQ